MNYLSTDKYLSQGCCSVLHIIVAIEIALFVFHLMIMQEPEPKFEPSFMKIWKISVFLNKYSKMNTVWYFVRFAISNNQVTFDILG